jgi:tripartite-type tricarboxylate transporter receptor subunit TctC
MRSRSSGKVCVAITALIAILTPGGARAQTVEEFYRGKTISMVIGYPAGGANDRYARTMARYIGKYIPGQPTVTSRNMPGSGSLLAANHVFNVAPKDGTVISLLAATIPLEEALGTQGALFKSAQFNWVGRMASSVNITFMNASAPVKTIKDAFTHQAILGGTGRSGTPTVYPSVLNNVLGMKFKVVMGYTGSVAAMLAMERGEIDGHSTSVDGVKAAREDWIRDKKINILVQYGLRRHPDFPDVPLSIDLGRTPEEVQILRIVANATEVGKMTLAPPGVPADRVQALRRAFEAAIKDPDYLAEMHKQRLEVIPLPGEELQKIVAEAGAISPAILDKVKAIYPLN